MSRDLIDLALFSDTGPLPATGLTKTAAVELAVDRLLHQTANARAGSALDMSALQAQLDQVSDRPDAFDPVEWDDQGLPR